MTWSCAFYLGLVAGPVSMPGVGRIWPNEDDVIGFVRHLRKELS